MRNRYDVRFEKLRSQKEKAFIPFTVLGWPDADKSFNVVKTMIECGVSALELGIAFSDPVADGPIIQKAAFETIDSGFKVSDALELVRRIRSFNDEIPIGLLVYYNLMLAMGVEKFFSKAKECGVDGVLIADLPVECADEIEPLAKAHGIATIFIVSPLTTPDRLGAIFKSAGGFLYLVSRLGVTGTGERLSEKDSRLKGLIESIKCRSQLPILAGFGISRPEHARQMFELGVDGVITGSRIVELIDKTPFEEVPAVLKQFIDSMLATCKLSAAGSL